LTVGKRERAEEDGRVALKNGTQNVFKGAALPSRVSSIGGGQGGGTGEKKRKSQVSQKLTWPSV